MPVVRIASRGGLAVATFSDVIEAQGKRRTGPVAVDAAPAPSPAPAPPGKVRIRAIEFASPPATLANTSSICRLLCEDGNRAVYNTGRFKADHGLVNLTAYGCWIPGVTRTVTTLKGQVDTAAGQYTTEQSIENCSIHVGCRKISDNEDVRAFLLLRHRFEESTDANDETILDEHQSNLITAALESFKPALPSGSNHNFVLPDFVHEELKKLGKLGIGIGKVAYLCALQGIDLQPLDGHHPGHRRRIAQILADFYGQIRARVGFIYGGLQRFGVYDTFMKAMRQEEEPWQCGIPQGTL